ncbi:hypothetical protein O1611_g3236 [Lasiodiplodia mahajangana]|uniref:Uncharacterized protein n=1 Tax=Lasiodiplodia mahajangana TaxID=1108764 RepID=A0ACC2JT16_9PEZI|nr:hypothetical protein O1611_g3236 [Lasiodiplodia mahajangana]
MDEKTESGFEEHAGIGLQTDQVLWRQLSEINSALELQHDKRAVIRILNGLRDSTRSIIQNRVRPRIRPLNILDLPNEILRIIFGYARDETRTSELHYELYVFKHENIIKNIRLTCRRFYETSSHLLIRVIRVHLTRASLAHLDEVSHHPLISKGVRAIKLGLGPFYDEDLIHDPQAFAHFRGLKLWRELQSWKGRIATRSPTEIFPVEILQEAVIKGTALIQSFEKFILQRIDKSHPDHLMILEAHKQYRQLYEDQVNTITSLIQHVASAMKRMPTVTWVGIGDLDLCQDLRMQFRYVPEDLNDIKLIIRKQLLAPTWWIDLTRRQPTPSQFNLVKDFFLSIQQLKIHLSELVIELPPPAPLPFTQTIATTHVKQLKAITFHPRASADIEYWLKRGPDEWAQYTRFVQSFLHTESLQKIDLSCYIWWDSYSPPPRSLAPLLLSYSWPNLKVLHFNGPFHFEELKAVVQPLGQEVDLKWAGYLISGRWADVLDFLRERKSLNQAVGNSDTSIQGQECDDMDTFQKHFIFKDKMISTSFKSLATRYIQGWIPGNPVRDWVNGDLYIPSEREYMESLGGSIYPYDDFRQPIPSPPEGEHLVASMD